MSRDELKEQLAEWRHYLHEHPESAFDELTDFLKREVEFFGKMWN